jgi:Uncharacterised nucleotidyltransferase
VSATDVAARHAGLCWPAAHQRLLLRVLYGDPEKAGANLDEWRRSVDLARLDAGSLALMPLLHRRVAQLALRTSLAPLLKGAYRWRWCRNQLLLRETLPVVAGWRAAGVPVLALKGLALLDRYGDRGLRALSDLDVLVSHPHAPTLLRALATTGWRARVDDGPSPAQPEDRMAATHAASFVRGRAEIDLHWASLAEDLSPGGDARLWSRAAPSAASVPGTSGHAVSLLVPAPVDLLLQVCVHGARWSRTSAINWVPDALLILGRPPSPFDWRALIAEARRRHLQVPLAETLRFLREELGAPVPSDVLPALEPDPPGWIYWSEYYARSAPPGRATSTDRAAARLAQIVRAGGKLPRGSAEPRT